MRLKPARNTLKKEHIEWTSKREKSLKVNIVKIKVILNQNHYVKKIFLLVRVTFSLDSTQKNTFTLYIFAFSEFSCTYKNQIVNHQCTLLYRFDDV